MRKLDVVAKIAQKTGIDKIDVLVTLEAFFKEIKDVLSDGETISIRGFGSFTVKKRARKIGRNIRKNEAVEIPEANVATFKPSKALNEAVNRGTKRK
ncbi:MAG: integration host factor subunit beta [Sphingobacteriales bacterium]|nr:MAG: integration host factor subunit beta [Sphingobacteriales bacterium]